MNSNLEKLELRKLGSNTAQTLLRQSLAIMFGLGLSILLARVLGPEGYGQYTMGILLPTMLATFLDLGVPASNVYHIASEKVSLYKAFKTTIEIWFILSIVGILIATSIISTQNENWFPNIPVYLLWLGTLAFPLALLQSLLSSFFQGLQNFKKYNTASLISPITTLFLSLVLVGILNQGMIGALTAFIGGPFSGLLVTIILLWPYIKKDKMMSRNKSSNYFKECIGYGWKAHLSNILTVVNYRADIFLVNFFVNPTATGVYVIAVNIAEGLWIISKSINMVILPRLSELNKDEKKRQHLTPLIARWVLFISAVGAIIMAFLAPPFIQLVYGIDYSDAIDALLWLLPGILIGSMARVLANDIAARGRPELNLYISILVVFTNVIANIILIPKFGIKGAAIATTLAYTLDAIAKIWMYSYISKNPWWKPIMFNSEDKWLFNKIVYTLKEKILKSATGIL